MDILQNPQGSPSALGLLRRSYPHSIENSQYIGTQTIQSLRKPWKGDECLEDDYSRQYCDFCQHSRCVHCSDKTLDSEGRYGWGNIF